MIYLKIIQEEEKTVFWLIGTCFLIATSRCNNKMQIVFLFRHRRNFQPEKIKIDDTVTLRKILKSPCKVDIGYFAHVYLENFKKRRQRSLATLHSVKGAKNE